MMRLPAATFAVFSLAAPAEAERGPSAPRVAPAIVYEIAPGLGSYTDEVLFGDVWKRAALAPRERSIVTVTALIAGGHTAQMTGHFNRALDNGVKPSEIAGIITHLAFYSGWPRAMSAVAVAKDVFEKRGIAPDQLSSVSPERLPLEPESEARRAAAVQAAAGTIAPALVAYTNDVLFADLWRRTASPHATAAW
jgi:4-carboxymuconolactone decarboxylase